MMLLILWVIANIVVGSLCVCSINQTIVEVIATGIQVRVNKTINAIMGVFIAPIPLMIRKTSNQIFTIAAHIRLVILLQVLKLHIMSRYRIST